MGACRSRTGIWRSEAPPAQVDQDIETYESLLRNCGVGALKGRLSGMQSYHCYILLYSVRSQSSFCRESYMEPSGPLGTCQGEASGLANHHGQGAQAIRADDAT